MGQAAADAALDALRRLAEGNRRFADNVRSLDAMMSHTRRAELVAAQSPFAIVLGCSDSRVPAEIVFDCGLGDLFVIRVAGNIVAPSQVGSIEFAASRFGTRLVVVLGHTHCGAILATLEAMRGESGPGSASLRSIVDRIRPAVEGVAADAGPDPARAAARANVSASAAALRHGSPLLEELVAGSGLPVVGAEYDLESGRVEFFDGLPPGAPAPPARA